MRSAVAPHAPILLAAGVLLLATPASAADWGSFDGSRMAYMAGALTGAAHSQLRTVIEAEGDSVVVGTPTLTPAYLDTVDVFYSSMLYAGTGGASGDTLGALTDDEADALDDWLAAGGTLILTVDSTGLNGDAFETIYTTWGAPYGIGDFVFDTSGPVSAAPLVAHSITTGVETYAWINRTTFTFGDDALLLGFSTANVPFLAVLEPATGFAVGGRILVVGDHNIFADSGFSSADNPQLAANIAAWANGECGNTVVESGEECDDGNAVDDDACTNACLAGDAETGDGTSTGDGESSSGEASSGEASGGRETGSGSTGADSRTTGANDDTTTGADTGGPAAGTEPLTTGTSPTSGPQPTGAGSSSESDTDTPSQDEEGGGCQVAEGSAPGGLWFLVLAAWARRRRRRA